MTARRVEDGILQVGISCRDGASFVRVEEEHHGGGRVAMVRLTRDDIGHAAWDLLEHGHRGLPPGTVIIPDVNSFEAEFDLFFEGDLVDTFETFGQAYAAAMGSHLPGDDPPPAVAPEAPNLSEMSNEEIDLAARHRAWSERVEAFDDDVDPPPDDWHPPRRGMLSRVWSAVLGGIATGLIAALDDWKGMREYD